MADSIPQMSLRRMQLINALKWKRHILEERLADQTNPIIREAIEAEIQAIDRSLASHAD